MKKLTTGAALLLFFALSSLCFAQSSMNNPPYTPYARFVIPIEQQPQYSGMDTNITTFSTWDTNGVETVVSVTNTVPLINPETYPYCDFELFAVDQTNPTNPVFYATSIHPEEWGNYPDLKGNSWGTVELQ